MVKVFDWNKAAEIIKDRQPSEASAGLIEDWGWTGGEIYRDGKPVPKEETYTYLGSDWATPVLVINDDEVIDCYVRVEEVTADCHAGTYWPQSALDILELFQVDGVAKPVVKLLGDGKNA